MQYDAKIDTDCNGFSIVIKRATLDRLIAAGVKYVTLRTGLVDLTFDLAALKELAAKSTGDITLTAIRETGLTGDARTAVDSQESGVSRPAWRLAAGYTGADGKAARVTDFGAGRVTVGVAYRPAATEQTGSLFLVYSRDGKSAEELYRSGYDQASGNVTGSTGHFSVYGVGYRPAPAFTDTAKHPAKEDIDFVASRGLLKAPSAILDSESAPGTESTLGFRRCPVPSGQPMTRSILVAALGRLAGIDPAAYPSCRFNDVAPTAFYAPYAEWAASHGIMPGAGETAFSPDASVTREQMAVLMKRYADYLGYTLPVIHEAETFIDAGQITGGMKAAVQAMQQAGVMNGRDDCRFAPQETVTRAEAATILRRFVENQW